MWMLPWGPSDSAPIPVPPGSLLGGPPYPRLTESEALGGKNPAILYPHPHRPGMSCVCVCESLSCVRLCDSMDCSLPGSSVHWNSLGKNTGAGSHSFLQEIFPILMLTQIWALGQVCFRSETNLKFRFQWLVLCHKHPLPGSVLWTPFFNLDVTLGYLTGVLGWVRSHVLRSEFWVLGCQCHL